MRHFIFLAVIAGCSVASAADARLTMENYNKIAPGASIGFVYGCLGKETTISSQRGKKKSLVWKDGKATIRISLENDKVVSKSQTGVK
jgi:hypothetical protein